MTERYTELHAKSGFSFLRGACVPEDYIGACATMGASAIALTDIDGVYGAPRLHRAAKKHGVQAHIGAEVKAQDGSRYTLLAESRNGYRNLCRLITRMKLRAGKKKGAALPEEFAEFSKIPTINALTDAEHPCQILADIFTFKEKRGPIFGKVVTFVGDGACNVPLSWIFAAAKLNFELRIAAPQQFQPSAEILKRAGGKIVVTDDLKDAAKGADLLYTDVWISMGKEAESADRLKILGGYQINQKLVKLARPDALVMHCLPAYRGKEIDEETFEANADTIFTQAENRLHVQKAILNWAVTS